MPQLSASAASDSGVEILPKDGRSFSIRLWGRFPPGWLGGFAAGLTREGVSIVRGEAKKVTLAFWEASFELDGGMAAIRPADIDFLTLTGGRADAAGGCDLTLDSFRLQMEAGTLCAEVRGPDRLGFLGAVLRRFAFFALFPAEMTIETVEGKTFDRFRLKAVGGMPPTAGSMQALREELQGLVTRSPA